MMRVLGYVRVSTDEQAEGGVSLADQRTKVGLYARLHGLELVELVEDPGASAKSLDRPGLARVLALLDGRQAVGVVIAKLDRLTRSVVDLGRLLDRYFGDGAGCQLFSVGDSIDTTTAAGRLMLNVLMSVAQWERETIVERTRSAMRYKRGQGERISGRLPYGRDLGPDGRGLVDNPRELGTLAAILQWRDAGHSPRTIRDRLNARKIPAKMGGAWSESAIRSILKRHPTEAPAHATP